MSGPFYAGMDSADAIENLNKLSDRVTEQIAGTSTTSLTIGTGPQSLNVGPDKQFAIGQVVRIADNTDPVGTWMQGTVTGYDPETGDLDVAVTSTEGGGTHADWTVSLSGGVGPAGPEGPEGPQGPAGPPNSLAIGTVTSGPSAGATITGTAPSQTLNLVLPKGDKGDQGDAGAAATISVGTVTTGAAGSSASVVNAGTTAAAVLNFSIPRGDKGETGDVGPQGDPGADGADGAAATISVGTVTTGAPGTSVIVTNTGTSSAAVLDFTIPRGDPGDGSGDVSGPSGATDGHVALFDGATGKLLKSGGALGTAAAADAADFATASQGALADTAVQPGDLAAVATSGAYADLTGKPTIPDAQQQTDWNATSGITSIANKPAVIAAGADQASARAAIGAGTSNLAIGTTSGTAKAGDYQPTITSQANAEAGTNNTEYMTPLRTAQAIAALSLPDAPSDGKQYARKDGAWDEIAATGGAKKLYVAWLTSGTSFTVPSGCTSLVAEGLGAGGSGASPPSGSNSFGGGGFGAYFMARRDVTPGQVLTYALGAPGASVSGAAGQSGGSTTLTIGAETFTAGGGAGGASTLNNAAAGGVASGGDLNLGGPPGMPGVASTQVPSPSRTGHLGSWCVPANIASPSNGGYGAGGSGTTGSSAPSIAGTQGAIRLTYLAD